MLNMRTNFELYPLFREANIVIDIQQRGIQYVGLNLYNVWVKTYLSRESSQMLQEVEDKKGTRKSDSRPRRSGGQKMVKSFGR